VPATAWSGYHRFCPLARALDVVGERWTLVVVHELLAGPRRYGELQGRLPGIGTSVLADRLRKLEGAGVVERRPGPSGAVIEYALTPAGHDLAPAMASLRAWGVRYLYTPAAGADPETGEECFDVTFVDGHEDLPDESYMWRIDEQVVALDYHDGELCRHPGEPVDPPGVVATTSAAFMRRWAEGSTTWDQGRADGEVMIDGDDAAWKRMKAATGYLRGYEPDQSRS
jgi:DNA-binding HxlR family transcriptional regulator